MADAFQEMDPGAYPQEMQASQPPPQSPQNRMRKLMMDVINGLPDETLASILKPIGFDAVKIMADEERAMLPPDMIVPWGQQKVKIMGVDNRPTLLSNKDAMIESVPLKTSDRPDYMDQQPEDDGIIAWQPFGGGDT